MANETASDYLKEAVGALVSAGGPLHVKASGILAAVDVLLREERLEDMDRLADIAQDIGKSRLAG